MRNISLKAIIKKNVYIGNNVTIEDDVYIDSGSIIRDNVIIKKGSFIGANSIIGEYLGDFFKGNNKEHICIIGKNSVIRSGAIIYGDVIIEDNFQSGHRITIREGSRIGKNVRIGTNSDIQHQSVIGNYVSIHSGVFVGEETIIEDFVWLFPHVVITNDPTPPSNKISPVRIKRFASIAAGSIILPGVIIGENSLVGAGSVVTKNVTEGMAVVGNPAKEKCLADKIKNKFTGKPAYPWMYNFHRGMPWEKAGFEEWIKKS
ncbi:acyltransferase [Clostridium polynesiense]|uniref:acyltransferase n=1 Tax=Clostridium polynesiense TaxID=1325933 RepID=UPI00058D487C|nr:N-acetyltransferase [Clostridium polynesiense]